MLSDIYDFLMSVEDAEHLGYPSPLIKDENVI
jgi:hypothetical protein